MAIGELIPRYCLVMDNREVEAIEPLFTPDVRIWSAEGRAENLDHISTAEMGVGEVFVIETPGGGGYGAG